MGNQAVPGVWTVSILDMLKEHGPHMVGPGVDEKEGTNGSILELSK